MRGGRAYYTLRGDHVKSQFLTHVNGEIGSCRDGLFIEEFRRIGKVHVSIMQWRGV